ncbi:hypothetical protein [Engelhardtia mirabilis]|uniref:Uncharacterized protein n=1 Tax=Engelhardtia mirabilis TaxID=2528011 RepID=A0A518BL82_9BACT|nr:hypothetical protein Pla133_28130 [Planctomycetes bacterium Pla133]QDV02051.1 hypothetical protein Pla86_28120 [Planctomycetes bacterium Pla86]
MSAPLWEVWIPDWLPPGLNGPKGLMRMHHHAKRREKGKAALLVRLSGHPLPRIRQPVRVEFERRVALRQHLMDWDNAGASFKLLGDALVSLGVLADDSPREIAEFHPRQRVVSRDLVGTWVGLYAADGADLAA